MLWTVRITVAAGPLMWPKAGKAGEARGSTGIKVVVKAWIDL